MSIKKAYALMRNREEWVSSKYRWDGRYWKASHDPNEVGIGSRLLGDLVAALYQDNIARYAHGTLLDVGCGKAPFYGLYRPYVTESICTDWPNTKHGNTFVGVHCDLNEGLPFRKQQFDTILLSDVLEHLPEPLRLWQEMSRIMKPGAILLMNTPFYYWLHEIPFDYYRYTEFALRRFAHETGFTMVSLCAVGGSLEILTDIIAKHLQFLPVAGGLLAETIQRATFAWSKTKIGKRIAHITGGAFPYGYFLVARRDLHGRSEVEAGDRG